MFSFIKFFVIGVFRGLTRFGSRPFIPFFDYYFKKHQFNLNINFIFVTNGLFEQKIFWGRDQNLGGGLSQNSSQNFSFILLNPNIYVFG